MKKSRSFRRILGPFVMALSFLLVVNVTVSADDWYTDVLEDYTHYEAIEALTEKEIINGYPNNEFRPLEAIQRQHGAIILAKLGVLEESTTVEETIQNYKDIDSNHRYAKEIATLTEAGIFKGYPNGNFNPERSLTREQMATVLVRALNLETYDTGEQVSIDLSNVNDTHKEQVQILANLGITDQLEDFRPQSAVSRGAFTSFIYRALNVSHFNLSVMHVNDTHARVAEMPKAVTAINEVREDKPEALLLHAGDAFSGTLYFNEFEGKADGALMNLMGLDAMVLGNHEFDLGDSENGHQSLANFVKQTNFPQLGTNIDFSEDAILKDLVSDKAFAENPSPDRIYKGIIKEVAGEKIGIFGLTTESTAFVSSPKAVQFLNYISAAKSAVAYFESQGINKIIAVNHIGFDSDPSVGNDLLLAQHVDGIDIIVGGHSHTKLPAPVVVDENTAGEKKEPTVIVQADQYLTHLGMLDVQFDPNGVVYSYNGSLIPLGDKAADPQALEVLGEYSETVDELYNEEIGAVLEYDLPNPRSRGEGELSESVRANETALGNLITDGMLLKAKEFDEDVVIALQNGGGIRTDMLAGPVTIGAVLEVLPFGNTLSLVTLTGEELKNTLEHSVRNVPNEEGGFLHVSGMKFTFDSSQEIGERVQSMEVMIDGEYVAIEMDKAYRVTTNAFTARGGDGFEILGKVYSAGQVEDLGLDDWTNFRDHMIELGRVAPEVEGRIVDLNK